MILLTKELNDLTKNEKLCIEMYTDYNIYRTNEHGKSRVRVYNGVTKERIGKPIYIIEHKYNKNVPKVKRVMDCLMKNDPLLVLIRSYTYLEGHKKLYKNYSYEIISDGAKDNKILVKITHFDKDVPSKVVNVNTLRDMSDTFYHEYARVVNFRLALEKFPMYKISIDYENKGKRFETLCVVEHFDNNMGKKHALLKALANGVDPFYYKYGIYTSLIQARKLLPDYDIQLLNKRIKGKQMCSVQPKDKSRPKVESQLNDLMYGTNPFNVNGGGYDRLSHGYLYIHECVSKYGKIGLLYGISNYPYTRLSNHKSYNNKINTITKPVNIFYNKDGNIACLLEKEIKSSFENNFFEKHECSTHTETLDIKDYDELLHLLKNSVMTELDLNDVYSGEVIKKERVDKMEFINKYKKGLGDL